MYSIELQDVWLKFDIQFVHQEVSLRRYLLSKFSRNRQQEKQTDLREANDWRIFWALRGITLSVRPGEVIGLVGANGAGKSTLLMTMAKIYHPDRGRVTTHGKVGTLLSLGGGFDPKLTGVENIFQAGIFMGLSRAYIEEHLHEIIEMADIGEFIYAPIKTYSSGMRARLGFAIATHMNPDIVLLDEVLETGDQAFRKKSGNLLELFREQGRTVVIASHNVDTVKRHCNRAVWIDHGQIVAEGEPKVIADQYLEGRTRPVAPSSESQANGS